VSRAAFTVLMISIATVVLVAMWIAWRSRARRDSGVLGAAVAPAGQVLARFERLQYVSTTPVGDPLMRIAAPGMRYRGPAEVTVRRDGVTIEVAGECPVHLGAAQLSGSGSAARRVGKAVESDGLALLRWRSDGDPRELESSFRFARGEDHRRFIAAVDEIAAAPRSSHGREGSESSRNFPNSQRSQRPQRRQNSQNAPHTTQEDS